MSEFVHADVIFVVVFAADVVALAVDGFSVDFVVVEDASETAAAAVDDDDTVVCTDRTVDGGRKNVFCTSAAVCIDFDPDNVADTRIH